MLKDIAVNHTDLLVAYFAYFVAVASPGPANLAIAMTSVSHGRSAGLKQAFGVMAGSTFWGIVAAFGLSAILVALGWAFTVLKIVGGCYLLWLAYKSCRSAMKASNPVVAGADQTTSRGTNFFLRGLFIHLTNPKAVFAWLAIIALGLKPDSPLWMTFAILIGCEIIALMIFGGYALIFSTKTAVRAYARLRRGIEAFMALAFGFAGVKMLTVKF